MSNELTSSRLHEVLDDLQAVNAKVFAGLDDYNNPLIEIHSLTSMTPILARHSVIGGEELVAETASGTWYQLPTPNGDPYGPIDDAADEIEELWKMVVARYPDAAVPG
jgi:hypothetical protein